MNGKCGYSLNEESYSGAFNSEEEAITECRRCGYEGVVYIGQYRTPEAPENCFDVEDIFDQIVQHEDYCCDWAESFFFINDEVKNEMTEGMRKEFGRLLDKYGIRPTFGVIKPETVVQVEPSGLQG